MLRDGAVAGGGAAGGASESEIVSLMVGRSVDELFPTVPHTPAKSCLSLEHLAGADLPRDVSLRVAARRNPGHRRTGRRGRTELLRCLLALDPVRSGTRARRWRIVPRATPRARIRAGLGLVSEDRKGEGLAQRGRSPTT